MNEELFGSARFPRTYEAQEYEQLRQLAVERTRLLDTGDEERFDRLTQRARDLLRVSTAILSLITTDRQYLKSVAGSFQRDLPRDLAFCNATIKHEAPLIVPDTLQHPRFKHSPLVLGEPFIRFYAGLPLRGPGGWFIGSFCIIDTQPRTLSDADFEALKRLAGAAEIEVNTLPDQ